MKGVVIFFECLRCKSIWNFTAIEGSLNYFFCDCNPKGVSVVLGGQVTKGDKGNE